MGIPVSANIQLQSPIFAARNAAILQNESQP